MPREKDIEYLAHANEIYDPVKIGSIDGTDTEPHDRAVVRALFSEYVPNKQVRGDPRHTLFIARLNPRTTQETIEAEFSKCGKIISCRLVKDIVTGKSKRYAFVEYDSMISLERAHRHMNKENIDGAEILVERELERTLQGWKPRRLGGGFGGRKESGQLRFGCRERPFRKPIKLSINKESGRKVISCKPWLCITNVNQQCVMCNVCSKEFRGWCRAFTASEVILSILQAILLTLLVAFLTFLLLHFLACSDNETNPLLVEPLTAETEPEWLTTSKATMVPNGTSEPDEIVSYGLTSYSDTVWSPVPSNIACTWTPSGKTRIFTQYFEHDEITLNITDASMTSQVTPPLYDEILHTTRYDDGVFESHQFDGEPAKNGRTFIIALVKMRPPDDVIFGCTLTIISEFWTLTAASCIESIEEVDSLDSFVMMENFGELRHGRTHPVSDVLVHPQYEGTNKTYDIVALRSENKLTGGSIQLPTKLNYLLITIGERLTILGFGKFRSVDRNAFSRGPHTVAVHVLPSALCAARGDAWSTRHLTGGVRAVRGRCSDAAMCAGPLYARGVPCNYCAGTPLLQTGVLLGLMSSPGPCGAPCEPALYVNLADSRDWLNSVLDN